MSRLRERILERGILRFPLFPADLADELLANIASAPVIVADAVATTLFAEQTRRGWPRPWRWNRDFPNQQPPFGSYFIEFTLPPELPEEWRTAGALFQRADFDVLPPKDDGTTRKLREQIADRAAALASPGAHARLAFGAARDVATTNTQAWWEVLQETVDDVQRLDEEVLSACYQLGLELGMSWIVRGYLLIETADGQIVGPWVEWQLPVSADGRILEGLDGPLAAAALLVPEQNQLHASADALTLLALTTCLMTVSWLHRSDVPVREVPQPPLSGAPYQSTPYRVLDVPARPFPDPNETRSTPARTANPTRITQTNHGGTEAGPSAGRSIRKLPSHTAIGLTFLLDDISEAWPIVWVDTTKRPDLVGLWNASPAAGMLADVELHWNTVTYAGADVVVAYVLVGRPVRAEFFLEFALPDSESFLEYIVRNPRVALMQGLPRRNEAGRIRPSLDDFRGALKIAVPGPQILADELTKWRRRHGKAPERP